MTRDLFLAMDLGTTGNRVIAFSKSGEIVHKAYYEFGQIYPKPGWVEHDPEEILSSALRALREVVEAAGPERIAGMGITNQRETTILWDRDTGKSVHNAIVWQCRRTEPECAALKGRAAFLKERTGLLLDPYFSATKIGWLLDHVDGLREKAEAGRICFGTPDTWILWHLTGGKVFATEPGNASRTLLFNLHTSRFDPELLKIFGVPEAVLPEVKDSDALFGITDKQAAAAEIPIHGILGDQQASLFADCGEEKGAVKNTYGTGLFVMSNTRSAIPESEKLIATVAWHRGKETRYAAEGSIFMGGAVIQWLRDNLGILKDASESEALAAAVADNEGVYFVPAFQGLGAPYWNPKSRGAIFGLSRKAGRRTLARAALESLAYQTRDVVEEMKKTLALDFRVLRVDGGACRNDFLMQFQADILGMRVERPRIIETTALGAAGIAAIAAGFWTEEEFRKVNQVEKAFDPRMPDGERENLYRGWKDAVERTLVS